MASYTYYHVKVPAPANPGTYLGSLQFGADNINVFLQMDSREVLINYQDKWYLQPADNYTVDSLADMLEVYPSALEIRSLKYGKEFIFKTADPRQEDEFYSSHWTMFHRYGKVFNADLIVKTQSPLPSEMMGNKFTLQYRSVY
jgi:hypothetical protein